MKKFDPNNFVINKVFDEIDKKLKRKKKEESKDDSKQKVSGPIVVEINA